MDREQLRIERQIEWLKSASPDDWHRVALDVNWDEWIKPLFWIVRQPECDRATALDVFWKGQPAGYLLRMLEKARMLEKGVADDEQDPVWAMLKYIAERIDSQGYTRSRIAYDATPGTRLDYDELVGYAKLLPRTPLHGHPDMLRSAHGREVLNDEDFYRRYPPEFHHSAMIDMPVPVKAWLDFPDMRSARIEAFSITVNLFVVGFGVVFMTLFPFRKNIGLYTSAFAALSYCLYKGSADFRTLRGLLRGQSPGIEFDVARRRALAERSARSSSCVGDRTAHHRLHALVRIGAWDRCARRRCIGRCGAGTGDRRMVSVEASDQSAGHRLRLSLAQGRRDRPR